MASLWGKVQPEGATESSLTPKMMGIMPVRTREHSKQVSLSRWGLFGGEAGAGVRGLADLPLLWLFV